MTPTTNTSAVIGATQLTVTVTADGDLIGLPAHAERWNGLADRHHDDRRHHLERHMLTEVLRPRSGLRRRDDSGAAAVITAIVCTVLFMIAALCLDLGNAFARRTDTQTQADYGALAAARLQTETAKSGMTIPTAMVDAVRDAMNDNQPQDDSGTCWTAKTCVTSAQLIDGNLLNGEIRFCSGTACGTGYASTVKGLQVIAPRNKVDYGFANVMGVPSGNVNADAWSTSSRPASG